MRKPLPQKSAGARLPHRAPAPRTQCLSASDALRGVSMIRTGAHELQKARPVGRLRWSTMATTSSPGSRESGRSRCSPHEARPTARLRPASACCSTSTPPSATATAYRASVAAGGSGDGATRRFAPTGTISGRTWPAQRPRTAVSSTARSAPASSTSCPPTGWTGCTASTPSWSFPEPGIGLWAPKTKGHTRGTARGTRRAQGGAHN